MKRNTLTVIISVKIIFRVSKELLKRFLNIYVEFWITKF